MQRSPSKGAGERSLQYLEDEIQMEKHALKARFKARPKSTDALGSSFGARWPDPELVALQGRLQPLDVNKGGQRDGLLYVPRSYNPKVGPAPLVMLLHGAGGTARQALALMLPYADAEGLLLVAPESRGRTWDVILSTYGPDVAFLDTVLEKVFQTYYVDVCHLAIGGFSDGASYALSLGICNGALFSHVIAFSPGFMRPPRHEDSPHIYVSHGTEDAVLNVNHCSRSVVRRLQEYGYKVLYHEFPGGHIVPPEVVGEALDWFWGRYMPESEGHWKIGG